MKRAAVCPMVAKFFAEDAAQKHMAVLFRGRIYVAAPRHLDAINLAFASMTQHEKHRVSLRIADGKEKMLFGTALGDGSGWDWSEEYQNTRMLMYGFEPTY